MDNFIDDRFIKTAGDAKISLILPGIGVALGIGNHLLQRKDMEPEGRFRSLMRSMLLGGMAGTGAEMLRLGGTNFVNRFWQDKNIPDDVRGRAIPEQGMLWGTKF